MKGHHIATLCRDRRSRDWSHRWSVQYNRQYEANSATIRRQLHYLYVVLDYFYGINSLKKALSRDSSSKNVIVAFAAGNIETESTSWNEVVLIPFIILSIWALNWKREAGILFKIEVQTQLLRIDTKNTNRSQMWISWNPLGEYLLLRL